MSKNTELWSFVGPIFHDHLRMGETLFIPLEGTAPNFLALPYHKMERQCKYVIGPIITPTNEVIHCLCCCLVLRDTLSGTLVQIAK